MKRNEGLDQILQSYGVFSKGTYAKRVVARAHISANIARLQDNAKSIKVKPGPVSTRKVN